ncbi:MAG: hypothetical protein GXP33_15545 [Spirochaetes bacterium]|nr:hypothetical protein [Spirochaetota bacterium]
MRKFIPVMLFFVMASFIIFADERTDSFTEDITGYHGVGKATAADKDEALRLAKADALKLIFSQIGKDKMFQEMFISSWPGSISIEKDSITEDENGFTASVTVKVDRNSIIMTEGQYRVAAVSLLDRAEKIIEDTEKTLNDAETAEENLRMSEALIGYKHALTRCNENSELLKNLGDNSISATDGKNLSSILSVIDSLKLRSDTGLKRLEELAKKSEKSAAMEEISKALDLIGVELAKIENTSGQYSKIEPFYDLPKEQLQSILIDVNSFIEREAEMRGKLDFLFGKVSEENLFLKERIEITWSDLDRSGEKLAKMKKELNLEIKEPRLVRQEKARKREERKKAVINAVSYLFLHNPSEVLSFRYYIPVDWDGEKKFSFIDENNWVLASEGLFSGFWIHGSLENREHKMMQSKDTVLASQAGIGIAQKVLFGVGFSWEWIHTVSADSAGKGAGIKENAFTLFFGGPNSNGTAINWLFSFTYRIPLFFDPFIAPYQMNAGLNWLVRAGNILLVEAGVSSGCYQNMPGTREDVKQHIEYQLRWNAGIALRLPAPFTWGIYYTGTGRAPLSGNTLGSMIYQGAWSSYIGYSF